MAKARITPASIQALVTAGRSAEAAELARRASAAFPNDPLWLHALGIALHATGSADEAQRALRRALEIHPGYRDARVNLAVLLRKRAERHGARVELEQVLREHPGFAPAQREFASLLIESGQAREALPILEALSAQFPEDADLMADTAAALQRVGLAGRSGEACQRALERASDPRTIGAVAHTLAMLGNAPEAEAAAERAMHLAPDSADVHLQAGLALTLIGRHERAAASYRTAVARRPRDPALLEHLGWASHAQGDHARAAEAFQDQLRLAPDSRAAHVNLAVAMRGLRRPDEEIRLLAEAAAKGHRDPDLLAALVLAKRTQCDWDGIDAWERELCEAALVPGPNPAPPGVSLYLEGVHPAAQRTWAENWCRVRLPSMPPVSRPPRETRETRLRIGYLSADFYDHATARLIVGALESHDRSRVAIHAYSTGRSDGSALRQRVVDAVDAFVDCRGLPPDAIARRIAGDGIDVLLDLGGHVKGAPVKALSYRPAPMQVHFLGYPGTTGATFVDAYIADAVTMPPGAEAHFSETVIRMPACYQPNDHRRVVPGAATRVEWGLPATATVFCSFNQAQKLGPRVFASWCRLLNAVTGSVLWLLDADAGVRTRLQAFAASKGIDPRRLVFAPIVEPDVHAARLALADLALDTFPWGSHTTASDALWAGVPLVTVRGDTFASRVAASIVCAAGAPELAFDDRERAFEATIAWANDASARLALRQRLLAARATSPLYDAPAFARNLEALLEQAMARTGTRT